MRLSLVSAAISLLAFVNPSLAADPEDPLEKLVANGLITREAYDKAQGEDSGICKPADVTVRKEWSALTKPERREYIDAVLCLMETPPITPAEEFPGVRNRFDDFVATHVNQTFSIHGTGNFLTWHRYFTWAYELALRDECGYKGYQPYWNWGDYVDNLVDSPLFDGSEYSMSGNGKFVEHEPSQPAPYVTIPPTGGGCVETGPFKNMTVTLGPMSPTLDGAGPNGDGRGYNPRCLRRDISSDVAKNWTKTSDVVDLITGHDNIYWFQTFMQGQGDEELFGVHSGGHYSIGGDPAGDFFISPGDPAFYLHHAQIDRTYWIWQNQEPATRLKTVSGTRGLGGIDATNTTLDEIVQLGVNGKGWELQDLLDTKRGPFCYVYE
ncbi:hypothetical protein FQN54_007599 [Arachnomyces sp. PD_36]|nr:hypothetical protein FQN54_007599 [Arachnomyces sp. PD_36]